MNVREYWTVLREDKWLVGSVLVVCVAIAAAVALLLPRTYTSTAIFYVASPQSTTSSTDSYAGSQLSTERVKSYSELLTGPRVAADASALLGGRPSAEDIQKAVSADSVAETVVLNLGVTESTPQDAQLVGTAVATSFTRLVNSIESTGQPVNRPIVSTELIYPPTLPTYPAGPGTTMLLAAGLLAGVVLGVGAALGRRALRRAVDTADALETALQAPVLAAVPGLPRRPDRPALLLEPAPGRRGRRAARARDRAAAVRRLRTAVLAGADGRRCLVVAGVRAEQGTTTVALDLAVALALAGESVLLVDADLRRPALAQRLELRGDRGLATVLDGAPTAGVVQRWTPAGLDVLPAGPGVEHPGEAWGSAAASAALTSLREAYSWVLLDASPVATTPESVDLARLADGVVLVARRGSARPEDLDAAAAGLRTVGAPLLGSVFTFAVGVPSAPADAPRALPPGRSSETPATEPVEAPASPAAEAVTEPAATEDPVTEPVVPVVTAPARTTRTTRRKTSDATASDAGVTTGPSTAVPAVAAAATTPKRRASTRKTAEAAPAASAATPTEPPAKPATRTRKPRATQPAGASAASSNGTAPVGAGSNGAVAKATTAASSNGTAVTPAGTTPTSPNASEGTAPAGHTSNGSTSNGSTSNGTAPSTTPGSPAETGPSSAPATSNGAATTETPPDDSATPASSSGTGAKGTRTRRATRSTTRTAALSDATTTVEGDESAGPDKSADPDKPGRTRTTRTRAPRATTTGRGPDAVDAATRPARTRTAARTNPTSTPTSGS